MHSLLNLVKNHKLSRRHQRGLLQERARIDQTRFGLRPDDHCNQRPVFGPEKDFQQLSLVERQEINVDPEGTFVTRMCLVLIQRETPEFRFE